MVLSTAHRLLPALCLAAATTAFAGADEPWSEAQKLLADDAPNGCCFGADVAISGSTAFVGAYADEVGNESGAVYVFERIDGVWVEQDKLVSSDAESNDRFGRSLAVSGDTLLVGAAYDDDNGLDSGAAYVFVNLNGQWTEQDKLLPSDGTFSDLFGVEVAVSDDTALVAAPGHDHEGSEVGGTYVFVRSGSDWTEQAELLSSDAHGLASSVALSGDTALVGSMFDVHDKIQSGAVHLFERVGTAWAELDILVPSDPIAEGLFGSRVVLEGNTALISATWDDDNGLASGSVYVFGRSSGVWSELEKLVASDGEAQDLFGIDVALQGDTALIGASREGTNGFSAGAAYIFRRSQGAWTERQKLLPSDGATLDSFGRDVAISGDTALLGANQNDEAGSNAGAAYVFSRVLFEDGFESGDTSAWSTTVP